MTELEPGHLLNAVMYAGTGIVLFFAVFFLLDKLTPYDLWQEIVREKNIALAILVGCISIGMCLIIAAAVH